MDTLVCPVCGSGATYDPDTHSYVCPECGLVLGYEWVPSISHRDHTFPLVSHVKLDREVQAEAARLFSREMAAELARMREGREVFDVLVKLVRKERYRVSWKRLRKVLEIARKHGIEVDMEQVREERIWRELEKAIDEAGVDLRPEDVWPFIVKHRRLWAGRKSETIARVFLYLYCKNRLEVDLSRLLTPRMRKLAKLLERVVEYE